MYIEGKKEEGASRVIQQNNEANLGIPQLSDCRENSLFDVVQCKSDRSVIQRDALDEFKNPLTYETDGTKQYDEQEALEEDFELSKTAIRKMLMDYGLLNENILEKIDNANVVLCGKEEFAKKNLFNTFYEIGSRNLFDNKNSYDEEAVNSFCKSNNFTNEEVLKNYGTDFAFGGKKPGLANTIFINQSQQTIGGVHTLVHELMHVLANEDAVKELKGTDKNGSEEDSMGDEAFNEIVARVASKNIGGNWNCKDENANHGKGTLYGNRVEVDSRLNDYGNNIKGLLEYYLFGIGVEDKESGEPMLVG